MSCLYPWKARKFLRKLCKPSIWCSRTNNDDVPDEVSHRPRAPERCNPRVDAAPDAHKHRITSAAAGDDCGHAQRYYFFKSNEQSDFSPSLGLVSTHSLLPSRSGSGTWPCACQVARYQTRRTCRRRPTASRTVSGNRSEPFEVNHRPALFMRHSCIYQFEAIRPFIDGNGRLGRLLITLLLVERRVLPTLPAGISF